MAVLSHHPLSVCLFGFLSPSSVEEQVEALEASLEEARAAWEGTEASLEAKIARLKVCASVLPGWLFHHLSRCEERDDGGEAVRLRCLLWVPILR